jgi:puromycin-sensitive aminopeptidase
VAGESDKRATLRGVLLGALATLGADEPTQDSLLAMFRASQDDRSATPPDLADAVVGSVAYNGSGTEFEQVLERFRHPANPQDEVRHLYALGDFRHIELVRRTLELSMEEVRTQNAPFLLSALLGNRVGGVEAWEFVKANWDRITERLPQNSHVRLLNGLVELISPEVAQDARRFFAAHPLRSGGRTLEQILERLEVNVAFAERERPRLAAALG